MDKKFIIGGITFLIVTVLSGALFYWFAGNLNFFGEQGFHGEKTYFFEGAALGGLMLAPGITALVLKLNSYKKESKIMFICAIVCWILVIVVIPLFNIIKEKIRDSAPAGKIAMRAVTRTDEELAGEHLDSAHYAERTGNHLWIFEGTATRLSASKEKETVEYAAKMIAEKSGKGEIAPGFTGYGWRSIRYDGRLSHYEMIFFYEDGNYVTMYDMDKERWAELGIPDPPENEGKKNVTF